MNDSQWRSTNYVLILFGLCPYMIVGDLKDNFFCHFNPSAKFNLKIIFVIACFHKATLSMSPRLFIHFITAIQSAITAIIHSSFFTERKREEVKADRRAIQKSINCSCITVCANGQRLPDNVFMYQQGDACFHWAWLCFDKLSLLQLCGSPDSA